MRLEEIACLMGKSVEEVKQMLQCNDCIELSLTEKRARKQKSEINMNAI